ncbi:metal-dependent hydrolase [Iodobacter sp. HSC-16F04]|uniref:Metal-dependent hydrolase n=1 Tax=Iodobacter violaceini TaxID=3044271 RepID=A0ABX0KM41_9NEIS|nr:metal-dependent hydrolase [Iodobacter violacea]NHQ85075.1 metal-dependent hydrolase [Iodobacter violacea]
MFIAHIPSGYIYAVSILKKIKNTTIPAHLIFLSAVSGAILPDLDLIYFYLIDHRQTHHHKYITHWPLLWISLAVISYALYACSSQKKLGFLSFIACTSCILHMILDTVVGDIWWFFPFIDQPFALFTVTALYKPWWLNFILHWSFALELVICSLAICIYIKRTKNN